MTKPTRAAQRIEADRVSRVVAAADARADKLASQLTQANYDLKSREEQVKALTINLERMIRVASLKAKKLTARPIVKAAKHLIRVIVPDSHGEHIDIVARDAFLADLKILCPDEVVFLGDHLDCGGTFNAHQVTYTNEMTESYEADVAAANVFLDACCEYAPNARMHYLEGNHEAHVERWCARNVKNRRDAEYMLSKVGPEATLSLKQRGIDYYHTKEFHMGLSVRGSIRIGKCYFTHGISHSKHADDAHLVAFGGNVVFGHVHRALEVGNRTVTSQGHRAWSPGTLAKLQPLYRHTEPTSWTHGYGVQFANATTGRFAHWNVPIFADGSTGLAAAVGALGSRK